MWSPWTEWFGGQIGAVPGCSFVEKHVLIKQVSALTSLFLNISRPLGRACILMMTYNRFTSVVLPTKHKMVSS
jgi:hypothetical protein